MILIIKPGQSQNPLGVYVDIDGKIKFWESEANLNGHLEDTVIVRCGSDTTFEDLRNVRQIDLTLIEAPGERETMESFQDPGMINDTTRSVWGSHLGDTNFFDWDLNPAPALNDTVYEVNTSVNKYSDIIKGDGLTDSVIQYVRYRLENYVSRFYGTHEPFEASDKLHRELSDYDSIVDKIAIYDYLVDRVVFFKYNNQDQLIQVISYYWNSGVEVDHIKYDKGGNIIYFARESIGADRTELFFTYDSDMRVIEVMERSSYAGSMNSAPHAYPDIQRIKFTYKDGLVSSRSVLPEDGTWHTCYYEIKQRVTAKP